jgi:hypothetical protein
MIKYILARLRWGKLSKEQLKELSQLSTIEVFNRPYLDPQLLRYYK